MRRLARLALVTDAATLTLVLGASLGLAAIHPALAAGWSVSTALMTALNR